MVLVFALNAMVMEKYGKVRGKRNTIYLVLVARVKRLARNVAVRGNVMNKYKFAVEYVGHDRNLFVADDLPAAEKMVENLHFKVLDKTLSDIEEDINDES